MLVSAFSVVLPLAGLVTMLVMFFRRRLLSELARMSALGAALGLFQAGNSLERAHNVPGILIGIGFSVFMLALAFKSLQQAP